MFNTPHHIRDSLLFRHVVYTCIPKDYIATKMYLDNYDGLTGPREHVQNICSNMEIVIQDSHVINKIFPTTFRGSVRTWYNNLEPSSVASFNDLYVKLVAHFHISIPTRKSATELFGITQAEDKFTKTYLKRFNKEGKNLVEGVICFTR